MWPLNNHPELVERGRAFIKRWGEWAIVLAGFWGSPAGQYADCRRNR